MKASLCVMKACERPALKSNLNSVTVHDNLRSIEDVMITDEYGTTLNSSITFVRNTELQFLIVTSRNETFKKDKIYKMVVTYVGNINETPLSRGMFRGHYKDENGITRWYAATHLQPTHSRQLFPSFDEPGFKSTFDIIVHRPPGFSQTFSNMNMKTNASSPIAGRVKETFERTLRMSAYLISIHISEGFKVIADNKNASKPYRVIARPTASNQGQYALEVNPQMELEDQFIIMYLQSALSSDASINTRALRHTVNTPAQVSGHFTGISYSKGASLLLMLKHFVTENTFKKALNLFLKARAFQHASPEDLFEAFDNATAADRTLPAGVDITHFMKVWVDEPGYPVLNVSVDRVNGAIKLSQERYYTTVGPQSNQTWPLPLTFTSGNQKNFNNLKVNHVMLNNTMEIRNESRDDYFIFNLKQKGIYRVNYDIDNWNHIREDLLKDHTTIHHLNRAQIVDDIFAFMQSKRLNYRVGFNVLRFLKNDTSYYSWYPAVTGFNRIRNSMVHSPSALEEYDKILYTYLEAVISDVGYDVHPDETLTKTLNRLLILAFACNIGHPGCVGNAVQKFRALVDNNVA
ncbi:hypothetical protein ACJJTC_011453, partial [Scirpophaga incertulas]